MLVGLGLVWSGCLVEFGFGCVWFGLGPSPSKGLHYCVPWCGVLIHVACCVACRGRAVVVGVGVGVGWVCFGVVWLLGWVWFWLCLVWLQDFLVVFGVGVGWAWFGVVWLLG